MLAVTTEPDLTSPVWSPSSKIAGDLGAEITEDYVASYSEGSATWVMDAPLPTGLYEVLVMDTYFASAGPLAFSILLDGTTLSTLTSQTNLTMRSPTLSNPPQRFDQWRSLGVVDLPYEGILSVYTRWDIREEWEPVAVDRVVVIPLPDSARYMLAGLPADRVRYIVDEASATLDGTQFTLTVTDRTAWYGGFQLITNPGNEVSVVWELPETLPQAVYEVAVWIPENLGNAPVSYSFLVNGEALGRPPDYQPVIDAPQGQGNWPGGQWISLGGWDIPLVYAPTVRLALQMRVPADAVGEAAADAVAFLRVPGTEFSLETPSP
jgi:hypothetical protein